MADQEIRVAQAGASIVWVPDPPRQLEVAQTGVGVTWAPSPPREVRVAQAGVGLAYRDALPQVEVAQAGLVVVWKELHGEVYTHNVLMGDLLEADAIYVQGCCMGTLDTGICTMNTEMESLDA